MIINLAKAVNLCRIYETPAQNPAIRFYAYTKFSQELNFAILEE